MGEIISIRDQIGPWEFRIGFTDGEERIVSVDPDKYELFRKQHMTEKKTIACPFLRRTSLEKRICTVHESRPELCRAFLCSRLFILDKNGKKAGRVRNGSRILVTEDLSLLSLWNISMRDLQTRDEEKWESMVGDFFIKAGYTIIR